MSVGLDCGGCVRLLCGAALLVVAKSSAALVVVAMAGAVLLEVAEGSVALLVAARGGVALLVVARGGVVLLVVADDGGKTLEIEVKRTHTTPQRIMRELCKDATALMAIQKKTERHGKCLS